MHLALIALGRPLYDRVIWVMHLQLYRQRSSNGRGKVDDATSVDPLNGVILLREGGLDQRLIWWLIHGMKPFLCSSALQPYYLWLLG